jgi:hypothetical protein
LRPSTRIACFRDDVVFCGYIYQYFIYPTDYRRRNEYGQVGEGAKEDDKSGEDEDEIDAKLLEEKEKEALQPGKAGTVGTMSSATDTAEAEGLRKRK